MNFTRSKGRALSIAIAAICLACFAGPAQARGACSVDSGPEDGGWTAHIERRSGISCKAAKRVVKKCDRKRDIGWTVSMTPALKPGIITFLKRPRRYPKFDVMFAGGTPDCAMGLYDR